MLVGACADEQATGGSAGSPTQRLCADYCRIRAGCDEVTFEGCTRNCIAADRFGPGCADIAASAALCRREQKNCELGAENCRHLDEERDRCISGIDGGTDAQASVDGDAPPDGDAGDASDSSDGD